MKTLLLFLAGCAAGTHVLAQATPARDLVKQGAQLYDAGQHDRAIAKHQQALATEPTNDLALTYNALGCNAKARATCELRSDSQSPSC